MHYFPSIILHKVVFSLESKDGESKSYKSSDEEINIEKVERY